jgi:hypothetical protein
MRSEPTLRAKKNSVVPHISRCRSQIHHHARRLQDAGDAELVSDDDPSSRPLPSVDALTRSIRKRLKYCTN